MRTGHEGLAGVADGLVGGAAGKGDLGSVARLADDQRLATQAHRAQRLTLRQLQEVRPVSYQHDSLDGFFCWHHGLRLAAQAQQLALRQLQETGLATQDPSASEAGGVIALMEKMTLHFRHVQPPHLALVEGETWR